MSRTLPARANSEFLSKQAKQLLQRVKANDAEAREWLRASGFTGQLDGAKLSDCQHALARDYGLPSWPRLVAHVELLNATDPMDALGAAVRTHDPSRVATVLSQYPSIRSRINGEIPGGSFGATALIAAVNQGSMEMVDLLLAHGADINQRSHWWAGGFHVLEDAHGLEDFLIERGAVLDAKSASALGRLEDLTRLVQANPAAVKLRAGDGQTPLHVVPTVEIAAFLLDHGAEIDALDIDHESTPAQYLVRSHPGVARYLVSRGARSDIMLAAALGDIDLVRAFLERDPSSVHCTVSHHHFPMRNPHAGGHIYTWALGQWKTPHAVAHEFGHREVLQLLLDRSPASLKLAVACELGDEAMITALRREHPTIELSDAERVRLPVAAMNNEVEAVRRLLAAGWPADAVGRHGATALHWAGFHGSVELARAILEHQPPLEAREKDFGQTPLQWTLYGSVNGWYVDSGDYPRVAELLLEAGAIAPPITRDTTGTEAVIAVVRRHSAGKRS